MKKLRHLSIIGVAGVVAQLGERLVRNEEVEGSIPFNSTSIVKNARKIGLFLCLDQGVPKTYPSEDIPKDVGRIHSKMWMPSWMEIGELLKKRTDKRFTPKNCLDVIRSDIGRLLHRS